MIWWSPSGLGTGDLRRHRVTPVPPHVIRALHEASGAVTTSKPRLATRALSLPLIPSHMDNQTRICFRDDAQQDFVCYAEDIR